MASLFLEYCFLSVDCFGTPGDTSGDTGAIGDVRPSFSPSLSGSGDSFDGLCGSKNKRMRERERERERDRGDSWSSAPCFTCYSRLLVKPHP